MNEAFKLAPHEWALLRSLLDEALALPSGTRERWLHALPDERAAGLKPRLRALLANAHDDEPGTAARLLQTLPKVETGQFAPPPGAGEKAGDIVGPYKLVRELGSGGMGSVWLAEHTDLLQGRQVALKLPHGAWKRAGLAERLARERAILATLEHRHIARLYDAGVTAEGQPWLALEYVDGQRIDAHCRAKALPVRERLELFLQVARAVAHAHAQLVVHRDLKPANILVTEAGDVKLLDFGIAKLVAEGVVEETELTREAGRAFTPEYASPEQILGKPLGTASDVYSLGVVLFELLADVRPYKLSRASRAALEAAVAEAAVPRPSTLAPPERRRALRGDLDTIVLKALKARPAERYGTVDALADDLQRHLTQRPVLARPDSVGYRLRKFVVRQRLAVGVGTAVLLAVMAGAAVAAWQAREARAQQRRAEQVKEFIAAIFTDADPFRGAQNKLSAKELLERARERIERAGPMPPDVRAELQTTLAASLLGIQEGQAAESLIRRAIEESTRALGPEHVLTLRARALRTQMSGLANDRAAFAAELNVLVPLLERHAAALPVEAVQVLTRRAGLENDEGRHEQVLATVEQALRLADRHLPAVHEARLVAMRMRVNANESLRRLTQALAHSEAAYAMARQLYPQPNLHPTLIDTRFVHARVLADLGRSAEARALMEQSLAEVRSTLGPTNFRVATILRTMVRTHVALGDLPRAIEDGDRAQAMLVALVPADSVPMAYSWVARGSARAAARQPARAAELYAQAVPILDKVLGREAPYAVHVQYLHAHQAALAGDERAMQRLQDLAGIVEARRLPRSQGVFCALAEVRRLRGDAAGALALARKWRAAAEAESPGSGSALSCRIEIGLALVALGEHEAAIAELREALTAIEAAVPGFTPTRADVQGGLGLAHLAAGRPGEALPHLEAADAFWRWFDPDNRFAGEAADALKRARAAVTGTAD